MGKNILVVAATAKEIGPFIKAINKSTGRLHSAEVDILVSGIGLTASTFHIARQLQLKKYDLVIQAGVAGSFDSKISLGDVVAVKQDTIADQSVVEMKKLKSLFDLELVPLNQPPYKNGWLVNPHKDVLKKTGLKTVRGISVNNISTSKQVIKFYREVFHPATESMEGAAMHYVCLMEKIPFLQIRSISNNIGERNKKKWNMPESIYNLNETLISVINNLFPE
jgi:futalosine hydrolase